MSPDLTQRDRSLPNVDGSTLRSHSPSFVVSALDSQAMSRHSDPRSLNPSAWPVSYEVCTLERRGRSSRPSPLVLSSAPQCKLPTAHQSPSPRTLGPPMPSPFGSPPSTPGASVRSFASSTSESSKVPSLVTSPLPASFPPRAVDLDNNKSFLSDNPADSYPQSSLSRSTPRRPAEQGPPPASTQDPANRLRSRVRSSRTVIQSPAGTPPTSPRERNSFASPPILGNGTPPRGRLPTGTPAPNLPANVTLSAAGIRVPSLASLSDDQSYSLDFPGVADAMQMRGVHASWSSISIQSTAGEKEASIRPSRLLQGEVHKPWLEKRDWRVRASWWITFCTMFIGIGASALVCVKGLRAVPMITTPLCLVLDDNFDTFDTHNIWHQEVEMSGFGNGEFEMTTTSPNNSFVRDGKLYIVPTLTSDVIGEAAIYDGHTFNVTGCTGNPNACGAVSNATAGAVINPVMSARLTTQFSRSIRYGKVEIRAKLPTGDWLWPALWMMPVDSAYGPWPLSGEIDLVEARGNGPSYPNQGIDYVRSSLNWGPTIALNRAFKTFDVWYDRRGSFGQNFHTYTLEWTQDFLRVYVDSRLRRTLDLRFNVPFFARGDFPAQIMNNSESIPVPNPWEGRGNSAPFDQPFFLIMDVAVGGTNGWFPDNVGGKPWIDGSKAAMRQFAEAQDQWYQTWPKSVEDRGMVVDYVRMWQQC